MLCQRNVNRVFPPAVNLGERDKTSVLAEQ